VMWLQKYIYFSEFKHEYTIF